MGILILRISSILMYFLNVFFRQNTIEFFNFLLKLALVCFDHDDDVLQ